MDVSHHLKAISPSWHVDTWPNVYSELIRSLFGYCSDIIRINPYKLRIISLLAAYNIWAGYQFNINGAY